MKGNKILVLLLIIVLGISVLYINSSEILSFGTKEIIIESKLNSNLISSFSKEKDGDFDLFINIINKSQKSMVLEKDVSFNHYIRYQGFNKEKVYLVDIDVINKDVRIYDREKKNMYIPDEVYIQDILLHPVFSSSYIDNSLPKLHIEYDNDIMAIDQSNLDWNYKKIDKKWYKTTLQKVNKEIGKPFIVDNPSQNIRVSFDIEPEVLNLKIYDSEKLLYEGLLSDSIIKPYTENGNQTYVIEGNWPKNIESEFYGNITYSFNVLTDLPAKLNFSTKKVESGSFVKLKVDNLNENETAFLKESILGSFQFYNVNGSTIGYLPISYDTKPGKYPIEFWTENHLGEKSSPINYSLNVSDRNYKVQQLKIDNSTVKTTRNEEANNQFAEYFNPARDFSVPEKLWEGPFIKPVDGRTSTTYGERRYVNNAPTPYRHSGMDIAVSKGTPIKATNNGRVTLAMNLILTGNTIVIDHGLGIFSVYFHCDSLNVEKGQVVKKYDIIGKVGSTGFSTGPHLHWTMSIFDQNIDPELVINNSF